MKNKRVNKNPVKKRDKMIDKKIFSLSRFFHEKPSIPCYVAGRFFDRDLKKLCIKIARPRNYLQKISRNFIKNSQL